MRIRAAVLECMGAQMPYAQGKPLLIQELTATRGQERGQVQVDALRRQLEWDAAILRG